MKQAMVGLTVLLLWGTPALAQGDAQWMVYTSVLTRHFHPEPHHTNQQRLLALEYYLDPARGLNVGGATFRNTFDQRSFYAYLSKRFDHPDWPVYARLTGGLLYGYRGEFRSRVPLNQRGFSPGLVPMVGAHAGRYHGELVLFGIAGIMINVGVSF